MNKLNQIYNILLKTFNHQGWWPVTDKDNNETTPNYHKNDYSYPKNNTQIFEIIIGSILTQNTSWKNVEKAITNLQNNNLLDIDKIINTKKETIANLIKPAGYFNQKAERLKIIAEFFKDNLELFKKEKNTNILREKLLEIKGIGPETADSILLYAFHKSIFVIDAYTKRIMQRVGFKENDYNDLQMIFMDALNNDFRLFNEYHALLVELAKKHCTKTNNLCSTCPINKECNKSIY